MGIREIYPGVEAHLAILSETEVPADTVRAGSLQRDKATGEVVFMRAEFGDRTYADLVRLLAMEDRACRLADEADR